MIVMWMRLNIISPILLLVLPLFWSAETETASQADAFSFVADHQRIGHRPHNFHSIRSAVAFGRSASDDSEWYQPPKSDVADDVVVDLASSSSKCSDSTVDSDNHPTRRHGVYTIQQTTIKSLQQFYNVLGVSPSLPDASGTNITKISSHIHYDDNDELILVKLYASWCKSCQKVGYKVDQLISELPIGATMHTKQQRHLHILHVDYTSNRELFQQFNITQLPTIHVYVKRQPSLPNKEIKIFQVVDLPCPPQQFYKVRNWVVSYYNHQKSQAQPSLDTTGTAVLDFGHDMIESSVIPILRVTTNHRVNDKPV